MAESFRQIWAKKERTVPATSALVVDSIPLADFRRLEYIIEIREIGGAKSVSFKFAVMNVETDVNHQVFAKHGDSLDYEISPKVNGSECEIEIVNNETTNLGATLVRSKL